MFIVSPIRNRSVAERSFVIPNEVRNLLFAGGTTTLTRGATRHHPRPRKQGLKPPPQSPPLLHLLLVPRPPRRILRRRTSSHLCFPSISLPAPTPPLSFFGAEGPTAFPLQSISMTINLIH